MNCLENLKNIGTDRMSQCQTHHCSTGSQGCSTRKSCWAMVASVSTQGCTQPFHPDSWITMVFQNRWDSQMPFFGTGETNLATFFFPELCRSTSTAPVPAWPLLMWYTQKRFCSGMGPSYKPILDEKPLGKSAPGLETSEVVKYLRGKLDSPTVNVYEILFGYLMATKSAVCQRFGSHRCFSTFLVTAFFDALIFVGVSTTFRQNHDKNQHFSMARPTEIHAFAWPLAPPLAGQIYSLNGSICGWHFRSWVAQLLLV